MNSRLLIILFLCNSFNLFSQSENLELTSEKKAFIYHVIWKNKRLEKHLGPYFEYVGQPYLKNSGKPKRDSVEWSIKNNGNNLLIRTNELSKVSKGMLTELCNKLALHDLNLIIKHRSSEEPIHQEYLDEYEELLEYYTKKLPPSATREKDGKTRPIIKFEKILAPTYSTRSKINVVSSGGAFDVNETKAIINAINETIGGWVQNRAKQYFELFGGRATKFQNQLMSAGDGSGFAGASKEAKQDPWYRGLTPSVGFFYYEPHKVKDNKTGNMVLKTKHVPVLNYNTYGYDTITNIHFDVWAKSQERQTTVVIQKGMYSYILYDKDESDLLSPDSAYGKEGVTTYQMLMDELQNVHIHHYEELIYGKRGYDYLIEYHSGMIDVCLEKIKVTEYKLNQIRYQQGSGNVVNYKPKNGKDGPPNSNQSVKKKKKTTQDILMYWYEQLEFHKNMVKKLKEEKAIALELLATLKDKLSDMNKNIGYKVMTYEEKDGLYIFEDSSTFDYETQDFKFNTGKFPEEFNIRILAMDDKVLSSQADEVQMHWSITEEDEDEKLDFNIQLVDQFGIDSWSLGKSILGEKDSVKIKEMITYINENPKKLKMNLEANGLSKIKSNGKAEKDYQPEYFDEYPSSNPDATKQQRLSTIQIGWNRELNIKVASFTDGFKSKINPEDKKLVSFMAKNQHITKNEILTALRTVKLINQFANEIELYGEKYFEEGEHKSAAEAIRKLIKKAKISFGKQVVKVGVFSTN